MINSGTTHGGPLGEISRLAHESEIRRQIIHNNVRKAGRRVVGRMPTVLVDFLKMLSASVVGFWVLTELLAYISAAEPLYTLPALALLFSAQATMYKIKLAKDPNFEIPSCGCGGARPDDTAAVLRSRESAIFGVVPNSVLAIPLYAALLAAIFVDHRDTAVALAISAALASAYFSYVMVVRLARLCATCVNVAALNLLILVQFLR